MRWSAWVWMVTGLWVSWVGVQHGMPMVYFVGAVGLWIGFGLLLRLDEEPKEHA